MLPTSENYQALFLEPRKTEHIYLEGLQRRYVLTLSTLCVCK